MQIKDLMERAGYESVNSIDLICRFFSVGKKAP